MLADNPASWLDRAATVLFLDIGEWVRVESRLKRFLSLHRRRTGLALPIGHGLLEFGMQVRFTTRIRVRTRIRVKIRVRVRTRMKGQGSSCLG